MTKGELAKLVLTPEELKFIDFALPEFFVQDCQNLLNVDPRPFYVWSYLNNKIGGEPVNLAERFYQIYNGAPVLYEASEALLTDAIDRGECWNREEKGEPMYNDYLALSNAIDKIQLAREEIFEPEKITERYGQKEGQ